MPTDTTIINLDRGIRLYERPQNKKKILTIKPKKDRLHYHKPDF